MELAEELRLQARSIRLGCPCRDARLLERAAEALAPAIPRSGLTRRQHDTMLFLQRAHDETGVVPSFDEIAAAIGLKSKAGVQRLVLGLEERGYLRRIPYKSRSLALLRRVPDRSEPAPKADHAKAGAGGEGDGDSAPRTPSPVISTTEEPEIPQGLDRRRKAEA